MARERILIVEDDEDILELLRFNLTNAGYAVVCTVSGEKALSRIEQVNPDLILLDIMLPGADGLDICRTLKGRPETQDIPIIMLTARGEDVDIITGLELGADDYITKPFSLKVVIARIRTVLRRKSAKATGENDIIHLREMVIHPGRQDVTLSGEPIVLTATEFRILHYLARRPGWVFSRAQIVEAIQGNDYPVTLRSIDTHIVRLRRKIDEVGANDEYIETVRGVGYRFRD